MAAAIEVDFRSAIDAGSINGAILCASDAAGSFGYNIALGERILLSGEHIPQQLDDVLYMASATKIITTIAALQCVEDGVLTLDGDLSSIAPELSAKKVLTGFTEDGDTPLLDDASAPITLAMLLTHTSGLTYDFLHPLLMKWRQKFDPTPTNTEGASPPARRGVEEAFSYPLTFQPGSSWMYGPSLDWAGRIIERVTNRTLGEFMQERIFTPLEISSAQFYPVTRPDLRARLVDLNPDDPDAFGRAVTAGSAEANRRAKGDFGGHGLFIAGPDYLKVLRSLLANDGVLLRPGTVDTMFQDQLPAAAREGYKKALNGPAGVFFRVGTDSDTDVGVGFGGLLTLEAVDGWYGKGTLTWGGGLAVAWFVDRENDLCAMVAVQTRLPMDQKLVAGLKQAFRKNIYKVREEWREGGAREESQL